MARERACSYGVAGKWGCPAQKPSTGYLDLPSLGGWGSTIDVESSESTAATGALNTPAAWSLGLTMKTRDTVAVADSRHQPTVRPQRLAIGVFGRAPVAGAVKRRLSPPLTPERAAELSSAMLADLLGVLTLLPMGYRTVLCEADAELEALKKNLPARWHIAATGGASFGARLEAGLAHLFDQNVEAAGIVTNDSPLVSLDELYEGFMWLTKRRGLLLGPTSSGGLYAFALTHPEPALLKDFDWKSDGLVDRLKHHARELKLDTQVLATVTDVETSDDLKRFVKEMGGPNKPIGGLPAMTKLLAANDFAFAK